MTRKQARRRKPKTVRKFRLPAIPLRRLSALTLAAAIVALCYQFSARVLDQPITSITVEGPFQRVTALQIEQAIGDQLHAGFFSADLREIRRRVAALDWIDSASVSRRWPGRLDVEVTEQVPAAVWGKSGLLNTRGELFVDDARHLPAELPRLEGPDGHSEAVAERYLSLREGLIPLGLDIRTVHLDPRGAWQFTLTNGIGVRLGRRDVDARAALFLDVAANIIASRGADIAFVDMRYSNGFTVGWKNGKQTPAQQALMRDEGMLAGLIE